MKLSRIALILMILVSIITVYIQYLSVKNESQRDLEYLSSLYAERVTAVVTEAAEVTDVLVSLLIANKGIMSDSEINTMMALAYNYEKHIAIAYMPNGIIEKSYPLIGNEASIGYNVFEDQKASKDAITAMQTREIAYSGPYMLMIGTHGLVARNPVYYEVDGQEVFWGFVAAIIKPTSEALIEDTGLTHLEELNYEYSIQSNYNQNQITLYSSINFNKDLKQAVHVFKIGQEDWQIQMYKNDQSNHYLIEVLKISVILVIITTLIFLALRQSEKRQNLAHKQALTDSLTSLYNRRALDKYEERSNKANKTGYTIFYLDLNMFKPVNDNYGHDIGDKLLSIFAERLLTQFRKDTFISRIGGDEFVIIFPNEQDEAQCKHVHERLLRISEDLFFIDGHEIYISSSIGHASFPNDGKSFSEVLAAADKNMFAFKEANRKNKKR